MATGSPVLLGLFDGHNAAACVYAGGRLQSLVQEERLVRVKNHYGPPEQAAAEALRLAGVAADDLDGICIGSRYVSTPQGPDWAVEAFERRYDTGPARRARTRLTSTETYRSRRARERMEERRAVVASWGLPGDRVTFHDHHETHAATAYYGLAADDDPYLVLTLDGGGDGLSGSVWRGQGGQLQRLESIPQEDSLGEIYAVTTHLLGFRPLEHEYKLMGMAPYAEPRYAEPVRRIYDSYLGLDDERPMRLKRMVSEPLSDLGPRLERDLRRARFDSICAGLQAFTEGLLADWVRRCMEQTGIDRVLAAGGVFMNVKANKTLSELPGLRAFEAFPSCGDESLPVGACYLTAVAGGQRPQRLQHCYLGNDLSAEECREAAAAAGEAVTVEEPDDLADRVAGLLAAGEIVARAAGPMEFGARALGNRSILADPRNQDVVRVINRMIKKRDFWMPFAPVVLRRRAAEYFANPKDLPSPYMMNTFDSTERRDGFMAAVHNADLTARPQLVEDGQNPGYEAILERFGERTGRHVLLNTSFNLHGFPIVCSAADAMGVLLDSGLERLVLGPLLVSKRAAAT
jgi:carbamoyltransferase